VVAHGEGPMEGGETTVDDTTSLALVSLVSLVSPTLLRRVSLGNS
jgi:hypothetical protein